MALHAVPHIVPLNLGLPGSAPPSRQLASPSQPPLPPLPLSFSAPPPRRGHRLHFTPLPGARCSLRLAVPSSLCLSFHSARLELQCG